MPTLFLPFTLKGITLRNGIVMSPMTMYSSVDGKLDDYHVSYLGARGRRLCARVRLAGRGWQLRAEEPVAPTSYHCNETMHIAAAA